MAKIVMGRLPSQDAHANCKRSTAGRVAAGTAGRQPCSSLVPRQLGLQLRRVFCLPALLYRGETIFERIRCPTRPPPLVREHAMMRLTMYEYSYISAHLLAGQQMDVRWAWRLLAWWPLGRQWVPPATAAALHMVLHLLTARILKSLINRSSEYHRCGIDEMASSQLHGSKDGGYQAAASHAVNMFNYMVLASRTC